MAIFYVVGICPSCDCYAHYLVILDNPIVAFVSVFVGAYLLSFPRYLVHKLNDYVYERNIWVLE